jgi:asparagine synthase (glutamine-hydrolysing)
MCGISGLVNCGNRDVLARMTQVQSHRGPDDSGLWERRFPDGSYVGFGSRRLAILDLSPLGHMPMANGDQSLWITYNGEVYNFAELRAELESRGHRFRSHTDTEVLLKLYEQDGPACVKRLNGMFAFAVCDLQGAVPTVFLARDHFGIKPLYYWQQGRQLAFASEVKALLEVPGIAAQMDPKALHAYLTFLWVPGTRTMFRGVFKLPPGHCATLRGGEWKVQQYWDLTFPPKEHRFPRAEADLTAEVKERFRRSVKSQMVSDVPIGAFLSAGLDSSAIVALMAQAATQPLRTYTITFPPKYRIGETTLDDPGVPARLAKQLGCANEQIIVEPDVAELLPRLVWHMDEPTADPALITAYLVCREARKQATVLLSGVGGDELFAGYRKHIAHTMAQAYQKIPSGMRGMAEKALLGLPSMRGTPLKGSIRLAKKMARSGSLTPSEQFVQNGTYLDYAQKSELYSDALREELHACDATAEHVLQFERVADADFLNQMLYLDSKIFMPVLNLTYNDKMSMASSVEVRVPFLDWQLAEFVAWNVPPALKLHGGLRPTTKYIFRQAMRDVLPAEVLEQPKAGFAAPVDYWLVHELRDMVDDLLGERQIRERGLFRPEVVRRYVDEHNSSRHDWSMQIWQFLILEIWMRLFLDGGARNFAAKTLQAPATV